MLNKYEMVGITVSIVLMALVLAFVRYEPLAAIMSTGEVEEEVVVVTNGETSDDEKALADALTSAATDSGEITNLVINDVRLGEGDAVVEEGDTVIVDYIGATKDGTQFDSSYERGSPFYFTVGGGSVIEGWEKGLLGMKVGGKRVLVIPSEMGYGNRQIGPIPPNSTLLFAVELLEIK